MTKFALKRIEAVKGNIDVHKLIINDKCEFDSFIEALEHEGKYAIIGSLFATLNSVANLMRMPRTRFRELKGRRKNDSIKDYEAKAGSYRLYLFKHTSGKIVVFGGLKREQEKDIKRMRKLKMEFIKTFSL
ncbi:MAG: hypothetical protein K9I94_12875 [Bacteroidales bacterium]|nr:hypothetical protein [Bacteroidales bacterium]